MNRRTLALAAILALATALGCGKFGPPVRAEYPEETLPDWVVVPEPEPTPAPGAGTAPAPASPSDAPTGEPPPSDEPTPAP